MFAGITFCCCPYLCVFPICSGYAEWMETLQNVLKAIRLYTLPMTIPYNSNKHNSGNVRNLPGTYDYIFCLKHFLWVVSHNISGSCICEHANMPHRLHYMLRRYVFSILKLQRFDAQSIKCSRNRLYFDWFGCCCYPLSPPPPFIFFVYRYFPHFNQKIIHIYHFIVCKLHISRYCLIKNFHV